MDHTPLPGADSTFCKWWQFSVASALSGAAGVRATLPVFVLSVLYQINPEDYPISHEVRWLKHPEICFLLGLVLFVEILADSIPAVDHAIHGILAPAHPVMGGVAAITPNFCGGLFTRVPMALLGGSLAAAVHSGKAMLRVGSTGTSGGMLNPVLSHCENIGVVLLVVMSICWPLFALFATILFTGLAYQGVKWLWRTLEERRDDTADPLCKSDSRQSLDSRQSTQSTSTKASDRPSAPALEIEDGDEREQAEREIERVLAAPNAHWVLGGGNAAETKREYKRLTRLLHPDRGFCSGERACLALQRVVDAHEALHGED